MAAGAKISAQRQKKGAWSSARCHAKLPAKKDRHVKKSSHGKYNTVKELVEKQQKSEASTARAARPKKVVPVLMEASTDYVREYLNAQKV